MDMNTAKAMHNKVLDLLRINFPDMKITRAGGRIKEASAILNFEFFEDEEKQQDAARKEWDRYCYLFGLVPEHFGAYFVSNGERFKLSGLAPNSPKFPIKATRKDGKGFKFTESNSGIQALKEQASPAKVSKRMVLKGAK